MTGFADSYLFFRFSFQRQPERTFPPVFNKDTVIYFSNRRDCPVYERHNMAERLSENTENAQKNTHPRVILAERSGNSQDHYGLGG